MDHNLSSNLYEYAPATVHQALIMLAAVSPENRFTFEEIQSIIKNHAPHLDARNNIIKQALTDLNFTRRRLKNEQGQRTYYWIKPIDSLGIFTRQMKGLERQDTEFGDCSELGAKMGADIERLQDMGWNRPIDYRPFVLDFQISLLREFPEYERMYLLQTMRELQGEYHHVHRLYEPEIFTEFVMEMKVENRSRNLEIFGHWNLLEAGFPMNRKVKSYRNADKYDEKAYPNVYALVTAISRLIIDYARQKGRLTPISLSQLKEVLQEDMKFNKLDNEIVCAILRSIGFNNQRINTNDGRKSYWLCEPQDFITHYPIEIMRSLYDAKLLNKAQKSIEYAGDTWNFLPGY